MKYPKKYTFREKGFMYTNNHNDIMEIEHLQERMELALLGNKDGLWDWNILTDDVYFSPRWKDILGYKDDEIKNHLSSWESRVHPDDLSDIYREVDKNFNKQTDYFEITYRMKHKDGHWVWILDRGKALFDEEGKAYRMIGTHTDVTENKKIQLTNLHQAQIIEQIHDSVISTDLEGYIRSWNTGAQKLFGYKSEEIIGENITILYLEEDHEQLQEDIKTLKKKGTYYSEERMVTKTNGTLFAELSLSLLNDEKGQPIGMIGYSKDITQRKISEQKLQYQAHHDYLTELPNRLLFNERLEAGLTEVKNTKENLALLFVDLDLFKKVNDTYGHNVGDLVLQTISERLKSKLSQDDTLARIGGDEFNIIVKNFMDKKEISSLSQKLLTIISEPIGIGDTTLTVSSSIGISLYPQDSTKADKLLVYADTAMYKAKESGRNNFQFYS